MENREKIRKKLITFITDMTFTSEVDNDIFVEDGWLDLESVLDFIEQEIEKAREEGKKEILQQFKNRWDNDNLGDYPKFGNAGIGMIKGEMRDYINGELSKLKENK